MYGCADGELYVRFEEMRSYAFSRFTDVVAREIDVDGSTPKPTAPESPNTYGELVSFPLLSGIKGWTLGRGGKLMFDRPHVFESYWYRVKGDPSSAWVNTHRPDLKGAQAVVLCNSPQVTLKLAEAFLETLEFELRVSATSQIEHFDSDTKNRLRNYIEL